LPGKTKEDYKIEDGESVDIKYDKPEYKLNEAEKFEILYNKPK